jgi:hypothetical protein
MDQTNRPTWFELESTIPLEHQTRKPTAEQITSLSADTIKRRFPKYVVRLSARRYGIKLRDALAIANGMK